MPFRFKLQKVLNYREQLEEEAKVDLAVKQLQLEKTTAVFEQLRLELRQAEDKLFDSALSPAAERWLQEQYVKGLRGDVASAALQKRMHEQLVDEARKMVAERAIERKLLEKLKERQNQQFVREEQLKEQRVNDETATLRYKAPTL